MQEDKPDFSSVPAAFLRQIEACLQEKIVVGETVYGSYSAAASFKIMLVSGRAVFAKGAHPGDISHITQTLRQEIAAYHDIPVLEEIAPAFLGAVSDGDEDGWFLALFDFILTEENAPLKDKDNIQKLFHTLQKIHGAERPGTLPFATEKNYVERYFKFDGGWKRIFDEEKTRRKFLSIFSDEKDADRWLQKNRASLLSLQEKAWEAKGRFGVLHQDLRLDNVMLDRQKKFFLIDWPNACYGPIVADLAQIIPSLMIETKKSGNTLLALYQETTGFEVDQAALAVALVSQAGHLADQAYRAIPPKMPRLRAMQKNMLRHQLLWAEEMSFLASPPPINSHNI